MKATCPICNKEFTPTKDQKYEMQYGHKPACSTECRIKRRKMNNFSGGGFN